MYRSTPSLRQFDHVVAHQPMKIGTCARRKVLQDTVVAPVYRAPLSCWGRAEPGVFWAHIVVNSELWQVKSRRGRHYPKNVHMSTDTNSAAESGDVWARLLGLAADRYQLLEIPYGDCPARFFMAIPKGGDGRRTAWLPPAARPGAGRAPSGGGLTREGALARCLGEAAELILNLEQ